MLIIRHHSPEYDLIHAYGILKADLWPEDVQLDDIVEFLEDMDSPLSKNQIKQTFDSLIKAGVFLPLEDVSNPGTVKAVVMSDAPLGKNYCFDNGRIDALNETVGIIKEHPKGMSPSDFDSELSRRASDGHTPIMSSDVLVALCELGVADTDGKGYVYPGPALKGSE